MLNVYSKYAKKTGVALTESKWVVLQYFFFFFLIFDQKNAYNFVSTTNIINSNIYVFIFYVSNSFRISQFTFFLNAFFFGKDSFVWTISKPMAGEQGTLKYGLKTIFQKFI